MVLVDFLKRQKAGLRCRLATDDLSQEGLEKLHAMARKMGTLPCCFVNRPHFPHYTLTPSQRARALHIGAVAVTGEELEERCIRGVQAMKTTKTS